MAVSGITLRLRRVPVWEERANDVLDALERDFDLLPKPTQEHIRGFLAERITNAQEEARTSGDPEWRSRLAQILTTGAGLTCAWSTGPHDHGPPSATEEATAGGRWTAVIMGCSPLARRSSP
jgi:hypothetical protein